RSKRGPFHRRQSIRTEELFHLLPVGNILTAGPLFNSLSDAPCLRRMKCVLVFSILLASVDRAATFESVDLSVPVGSGLPTCCALAAAHPPLLLAFFGRPPFLGRPV